RLHCNFNAVFCRLFDLLSNYFLWSAPLKSGFSYDVFTVYSALPAQLKARKSCGNYFKFAQFLFIFLIIYAIIYSGGLY
uniref:hypothetical protein n=1 Tax=Eubacterium sp. TaxID=142586 RepID=UPI003FF11BF8